MTAAEQARRVLPRKRSAATVLFTDPAGRVLVVQPTYEPRWELPGGAVEHDESPRMAARREPGRLPVVVAAVEARRDGCAAYREDGYAV